MANIRIEEESFKDQSLQWDRVTHTFDPELDILGKDKDYFESIVYLLINKESALAYLPPELIYPFKLRARMILNMKDYPMVVPGNHVKKETAKYLNALKLSLSENGIAFLCGPLSQSTQHIKQEIISNHPTMKGVAGE